MTPLEQIKIGIINSDMELVQAGYKAMTGESAISPVKTLPKTKPVSKTEPYTSEEEIITDVDDPFKMQIRGEHKQQTRELEDGTIQTEARKETVNLSKIGSFNMFEDDGETSAEYKKQDKEFDQKSASKTKVGRRKRVEKVAATCVGCGKNFMVLPIHQLEGSCTCSKCMKEKQRR